MSEIPPNGATDAQTPDDDLQSAFALSIREAVERLSRITEEERASNTAIERAARAALQFLRAAAQAHGLSRLRKEEDEHDAKSGDDRGLTAGDFEAAIDDLRKVHPVARHGAAESGAPSGGDRSAHGGGDRA